MGIYIVCNRWVHTYDLKYNQWQKHVGDWQ